MSKSRSGKTPNSSQNAAPTTTQNAIIPGKFMESDWYELLEIEEDENFISDIIDEITDAALDQVFDKIIKSRVLPHTVLAARELLLDIIEWQFLQSDPGEVGTDEKLSWIEDEEPSESVIDNWAQGAVPIDTNDDNTMLYSVDLSEPIEEVDEESVRSEPTPDSISADESLEDMSLENLKTDENIQEDSMLEVNVVVKDIDNTCNSDKSGKTIDKSETGSRGTNTVSSRQARSKSKKYRPHVGKVPNFEKISLESVTDLRPKPGTRVSQKSTLSDFEMSSELLVRNQYGRASGPKEVIYDEKGKVVKVDKLNVANFPNHRVPVKYSILDTEKTTDKKLNFTVRSPQSKKEMAEKNNINKNRINAKTLLQRMHPSATWNNSMTSDKNGNINGYTLLEPRSPLPPLMVDSMNVTDGVTIREGGLSKQVMKKSILETSAEKRSMYPICNSANRVLDVKDIVSETSPSFRYITAPEALAGM